MMHLLGGMRQIVGNAHALRTRLDQLGVAGGFDALLRIPGVQMTLATGHVKIDHVLRRGGLLELGGTANRSRQATRGEDGGEQAYPKKTAGRPRDELAA